MGSAMTPKKPGYYQQRRWSRGELIPKIQICCFLLLSFCCPYLTAQIRLSTQDTILDVSPGPSAPRLLSLSGQGQNLWQNHSQESLPAYLERNGTRLPLTWHLTSRSVDTNQVTFVYESKEPHLRLSWQWTARARFGPVEHQVKVENLTDTEYWLPIVDSLTLDLRIPSATPLRHFYVEKGAGQPTPVGTHLDLAAPGYRWTGWSSTYAHEVAGRGREVIPYEAVYSPGAGQAGWYAGIEFSGRTRITFRRTPQELSTQLGLDPDPGPVLTRLTARGSVEFPVVFLGAFRAGPDGAGNQLRPWVRAVLGSPHTWADPRYPLTVNNSWGAGMQVNETIARRMIADSAELGLEMFHLDAGWFRGVGDWYPNPVNFPHGLAALADEAHHRGLSFGLWVNWSQAGLDTAPGALNLRDATVRDWLVADVAPDWKPQPFRGQTIDLGVPAAHDYAAHEVNRIVSDYHLDMLEHDGYVVAQGCTRSDHPHAPPNRANTSIRNIDGVDLVLSSNSTDVSYHAVHSYYNIHAQLRRQHPGLLLEICNDGGRMIDFGSAAHGDYFSITDSYDPLSNRQAFYDTSFVLPAAMLETYVQKWPAPRMENFLYELRSGMMGWFTVMQDTNAWTPEQHAAARKALQFYKTSLRPLIREGQLYHISARPDGVHWDGMEYWDPAQHRGVVYAFHGSVKDQPEHRFALAGLDPRKHYQLHFEDGTSPDAEFDGQLLMSAGLRVMLPLPLSSEWITLTEMD
jgi:alpha-galactosidase